MPDFQNVMLDIETLGTRPGSIILSIGAAEFRSYGVVRKFYTVISEESSRMIGLTSDANTLAWWQDQSAAARTVLEQARSREALTVVEALMNFTTWCGTAEVRANTRMWGNGAAFDNVLLREVYHRLGMVPPWQHWNDRCYRTMKNQYPDIPYQGVKGVAHNALDDACAQAEHMILIGQERNWS